MVLFYLEVSTIVDKVPLVGYQDILYTNRGMMRLESPFISSQEIWVVDILFSSQPDAFFYKDLMGETVSTAYAINRTGGSTTVIPVANACNAVSMV